MAQGSINNRYELLLIGGSAGSLEVILQLLPRLRLDLELAIVIVMHRKNGESLLAGLLDDKTALPVKEVDEKEAIEAGNIYLAPADYHLLIEKDKTFSLDYSEKLHYCRPSIDITFETAAEAFGASSIAVLLSGANADGANGLKKIKEAGGLTIVQDPSEAVIAYMPQQAINMFRVDYTADTEKIIQIINRINQ